MNDAPSTTLSIAASRELKALIVEPNSFIRGIVADALRRLYIGHLAACASTDEAYETCHTFKPSFIVTDWEAGKMSGLDFTRAVRRGERNVPRDIPVILMAEQITGEQLALARQAGINELMLKPVSVRNLRMRVEEVILRPRKFIDSRNYVGPCRRRKEDPTYSGPMRRLTDEPEVRSLAQTHPDRVARLRAVVTQLTSFAVRDDSDYRNIVRGLFKLLSQNQTGIDALDDTILSRIWSSAIRYIEGVGMTPNYSAEVILRHFEAVGVIMDLPRDAQKHRNAIAKDLERLVSKRIHAYELDLGDNPKSA